MSNPAIDNLVQELFTSRQNCLLVNVSSKHNCDSRFDFEVLNKILPGFTSWCRKRSLSQFPDHMLITLCCTNTLSEEVVYVGEVRACESDFIHLFYLVRSNMLNHCNISLLRTTMERLTSEELDRLQEDYFDNTIFLDFYNWHTDTFRHYYKKLCYPFSVAVMDGFNKISFTEKETRKEEIMEICKQYTFSEGVRNQLVDRSFTYNDFAFLNVYSSSNRSALKNEIKKQLVDIASCFGRKGENVWRIVLNFEGLNFMTVNQIEYSTANIINECVLRSIKSLLPSSQEFDLFCEVIPNWKSKLEDLLRGINWKVTSIEQIHTICDSIIGEEFATFVVNEINKLLK